MAKILILFACGFIPGALSQCTVQEAQPLLKRSVYEFAVQLSARIAQENENHFVASTLSVWALLSSASLGADGVTLDEFRNVLRLNKQQCFNDRFFEILKSASSDGNATTVERSSAIFVANNVRIVNHFQQRVTDNGISEFVVLSFDNLVKVAKTINDYASRATHDTINDLVTPGDLEDVNLVMIDAVYFKGLWRRPFQYNNTEIKPFYNDLGIEIGNVNMMRTRGVFNINTIDLIDATVLELPFGPDGRYVMLIFLPLPNKSLSSVINCMMNINLTTVYETFGQGYKPTVIVEIPKFNISSELKNFKDILTGMGLKRAFDRNLAQFPLLAETPLYISKIVQKASVQVSEAGAEASAASASYFTFRSGPEVFRANKPFLYMIVDTATQIPLFTGAYSKPSL